MIPYVGDVGMEGCFGSEEFSAPIEGSLARRLEEVGAPGVELVMDVAGYPDLTAWGDVAQRLLISYQGRLSIHGPFRDLDLSSTDPLDRQRAVTKLATAIEVAASLGADHLVIHPLDYRQLDAHAERYARCREDLLRLCEVAARRDIQLAIENMSDHWQSSGTSESYLALIHALPEPAIALLDLGHAHVSHWDIIAVIQAAGNRLGAFHVHDNDGTTDDHQPVGNGTIAWDSLLSVMRGSASADRWILEVKTTSTRVMRHQLATLRRAHLGAP